MSKKTNVDPQLVAKNIVMNYFNEKAEKSETFYIRPDNIYVVWFCYILGGWKALLSTDVSDGMYYEVTHSPAKNETYLDAYKKWENVKIEGEK